MGIIDREAVHQDDGISIIEALVSCVLIGLIAATAVPAFIGFYGGIKETKTENNAMNLGQAMILEATSYERLPQGSDKCVPLLNERTKAKVDAQWVASNVPKGVDLTNLSPAYNADTCTDPGGIPMNGVTRNVGANTASGYKLGNIYYKVQTWIGKCYVPLQLGATMPATIDCQPKSTNPQYVNHEAYRVITHVSWSGNGCSKKSGCQYINSVTFEADKDQVFYEYTKGAPDVTKALTKMCVVKNTSALIDFLTNIKANFSPKPVEVFQQPSQGTLSTQQDSRLGRAVYRPNRNYVGTDTIRYKVQNSIGTWSDPVTLTVTVKDSCLP